MTCSASKIVTSAPSRARSPAHARPAGPEPTTATLPIGTAGRGGGAVTGAWSPTKRSSRPMATGSIFLTRMHCTSHWLSCGQTRPHEEVPDEARDVDGDRAALDAGGPQALDAALGFRERIGDGVAEVHLEEVVGALFGVPLGHLRGMRRHVLQLLVVAFLFLEEQLLDVARVLEVLVRARLLVLESLLAQHELVEVDLVRVEVGALHARELDLAADRDPARPPPPGAVHHDCVQAHGRRHPSQARDLGAGAHHRERADRHHLVDLLLRQDVLERGRDESGPAVRAVVGADDQIVAVLPATI